MSAFWLKSVIQYIMGQSPSAHIKEAHMKHQPVTIVILGNSSDVRTGVDDSDSSDPNDDLAPPRLRNWLQNAETEGKRFLDTAGTPISASECDRLHREYRARLKG